MKIRQFFLRGMIVILFLLINDSVIAESNNPEDCNLFRIDVGGKFGFINLRGELAILPQFDYAYSFLDRNNTVIEINGKYGFIDCKGKFIVPPQFEDCNSFVNGLAGVKINGALSTGKVSF